MGLDISSEERAATIYSKCSAPTLIRQIALLLEFFKRLKCYKSFCRDALHASPLFVYSVKSRRRSNLLSFYHLSLNAFCHPYPSPLPSLTDSTPLASYLRNHFTKDIGIKVANLILRLEFKSFSCRAKSLFALHWKIVHGLCLKNSIIVSP